MCAKCKQKCPCTKELPIHKYSEMLVHHLKWFSQMRFRTKLNTQVSFTITNLRLVSLGNAMSQNHEGSI